MGTSVGPSKGRGRIPVALVLLVIVAVLALGMLQYTWNPLARVAPEVVLMLFATAAALIGILWICANKIVEYIRSAVHADSRKDLTADLVDLKAILELRKIMNPSHDKNVAQLCESHLTEAERRCKTAEVNAAWRSLVQAKLQSLYLLPNGDPQIRNLAYKTMARSAVELDPSKRDAVTSILEEPGQPGKLKNHLEVADLYSANSILEEYVNDKYDSLDRSAWQLYVLCASAVVCLVALGILLPRLSVSDPSSLQDDKMLVPAIITTGALGGATGGFFSVLRLFRTRDSFAHEQTMSSWMIVIRPLIGAVFALAVSFFLLSGLLSLGEVSLELLLSVTFVAGFSEHFVIDLVNRITRDSSTTEPPSK